MSKILTIFGATGTQGSSVIAAILAHPTLSKQFKLRGLTRDPSKPSGQALAAKGVEPVKGDLNDASSLQAAIKGSYAVFAVTNFWETRSEEIEIKQGKNIADACKAEGVKHLVWSTLPHVTKLTAGKYVHVDHFDGKAKITEYIESIKGNMIATYVQPSYYASNIKSSIKPGEDGVPTLNLPWNAEKTQVPLLDVPGDFGKFVAGVLEQEPSSVNGRYINAASDWASPAQIVATISKVSGKEVRFNELTDEQFMSFLPEGLKEELGETMFLIRDFSYYGLGAEKKQRESNAILPKGMETTSWEEFVKKTGPWEF